MSFVQSTVINGVSTTSITSPSITTTAGNFLARGVGTGSSAAPSTTIDSKGNTWTASTSNPQSTATGFSEHVHYAQNILGGASHTFTWTFGSTQWPSGEILEFAGRATSSPITTQAGAVDDTIQNTHTGPSLTAAAGDDVVAFHVTENNSTITFTPGAGFTIPANGSYLAGATSITTCAEYAANVGAGSITAGISANAPARAAGIILAIKQAATPRQNMMLMGVG